MIIFLALLIWLLPGQGARTYIVDDSGFANYDSIQKAVIAASDGDTIYIKPGEYNEEIVLNRSLTLMPLTGETGPIVIRGDGLENGITISSDGCTLEGLTLQNFTGPAIYIQSSRNIIRKNTFDDANPAILIKSSSENQISANDIRNCQGAVAIWENSRNNRVQGNYISGCNVSLIIREAGDDQLLNNRVSNAYWGVWLEGAEDCRIEGNDFDSKRFGIWLRNSSSIDVLKNNVSIQSNPSATSSTSQGIFFVNASDIKLQDNRVQGATLGLGISGSRNSVMTNNTIESGVDGIFIKDSYGQSLAYSRISEMQYGIRMENCTANSIESNTAERCTIGLDISSSGKNNITKNLIKDIEDTAVQMIYSRNNSLLDNQIDGSFRGIILLDSPFNRLSGNVQSNVEWGLYAEAEAREGFDNYIDETNTVNLLPIVYIFNRSGEEIRDKKIAHLTMAYCKNVTIDNIEIANDAAFFFNCEGNRIIGNNISGCFGMRMLESNGNEIADNRMDYNKYSGIFLYGSDLNQIAGNNASRNNQFGISLLSCNNNTIRDNLVDANAGAGIWINLSYGNQIYQNVIRGSPIGILVASSSANTFYRNDFIDNTEHAEDSGSNNWDAGNVTGGNYWSGHIAKGNPSQGWPRMIKGGTMLDRYPFQDEGGWRDADIISAGS